MAWFSNLRGLANKTLEDGLEGKVVYSATGAVLENSGRFSGAFSGRPQGGDWTIDRALAEGFRREPYVYKAVDTIAEKSSSLEIKLKDKDGDEVIDHPFCALMNEGQMNALETGHQFRYRLSLQLLLSPRGVFVNVLRSRGGDIIGGALLPPDRTSPIPNEDDPSKLIKGFKVMPKDGAATPKFLSVDEVRWIRKPHPVDAFMGMTPLEAAGLSVQLAYFARLFNVSFMRNDGRPGGILGVEPGAQGMTDAEMDRIESKFGRGPMESGKLTVLQGKVVYTDTGQAPRDMQYAELSGTSKSEILSAFGVPESQIGNASESTFANADKEGYAFWVNTMAAHNRMVISAFAQDYDSKQFKAFYDTSEIEELQEPIRKKREQEKGEVDAGLRSIKSYADNWGIEVPDLPETRALYIKSGTVPIPGSEEDRAFFASQDDAGSSEDEFDDSTGEGNESAFSGSASGGGSYTSSGGTDSGSDSSASTFSARSSTQPVASVTPYADAPAARSGTSVEADVKSDDGDGLAGKAEAGSGSAESESESPVALLEKTEKALNAAAEAVITRQGNVVASRLKSPRFRKGTKHWVPSETKPYTEALSVKAFDSVAIVQGDRWADELEDTLTPIVAEACEDAALGIIDDLGLDEQETKARHRRINDAQAKVIAQTAAEALYVAKSAIKKHSESMAARIKEADEAGKDLDAIIADVQAYAEQYRRGWSRQVMLQVGQVAIEQTRLRVADLSKKQRDIVRVWVSKRDQKVRPSHKAADGDRVRLGQPFKVGGSNVRFPGDPLAPPDVSRGCRCRIRYVSKASGRAIRTPAGEVTSNPERKALELVWSVA